ncbi:MAG: hypothetical protein ABL956_01640 [Hyphomonadaceae bacterium]
MLSITLVLLAPTSRATYSTWMPSTPTNSDMFATAATMVSAIVTASELRAECVELFNALFSIDTKN